VQEQVSLPPVIECNLPPWRQWFGAEYYGALQVAANHCGLHQVPPHFPGTWQHGSWPPWMQVQPEMIVFDAPKSATCFVARQDEVAFLRPAGYRSVRAIGLPIIYTRPSGAQRIPKSLLVMPSHSTEVDILLPSTQQYVDQIASLTNKFDLMLACVTSYCFQNGLWVNQLREKGINVVRGAGMRDVNALNRMRALFETFEYVTTDRFGSHVFYALYFGAKVSIWGAPTPIFRENLLNDGGYSAYPDAIDRLLSEETRIKEELWLAPLKVEPWRGVQNIELGKSMLGHENKLSSEQMREAFGWTPLRNFIGSAGVIVRGSPFWRAAAAAKRGLLTRMKSQVH
jgi:hypothetical protein